MRVHSKAPYPGNKITNFAPNEFWFRGIKAASMEGVLQGLKFKNPEMQKEIMRRVGKWAKDSGKGKNWRESQTLWWQGEPIKRESEDYQLLLNEAYESLFSQNEKARNALLASRNEPLEHEGGHKKRETVLTVQEFTSQLVRVRGLIQRGELTLVKMDGEGKVAEILHEGKPYHGRREKY